MGWEWSFQYFQIRIFFILLRSAGCVIYELINFKLFSDVNKLSNDETPSKDLNILLKKYGLSCFKFFLYV